MPSNNRSIFCCVSLLLATSALAACDLMYPYEPPANPPLPQAWNEADSPAAADKNAWPDAQWWNQFGSPELSALMQEALAANDDLAVAVAQVREADAQAQIAGAPLLPNIEKTASASRSVAPDKNSPTSPVHGKSFATGFNASYELDFWGKNRSALDEKEALADASRFDKQTVLLTVTSSVANSYFDWLATLERIRIAQDNLAASEKLLDALRRQFTGGIVSQLDVAQQENVVETLRATIPPLQLEASQDRDALAILLGRLPETVTPPDAAFDTIAQPNVPAGLPSGLLARRPDVQSAEANLIAAHADINAARAAFLPDITLTAGDNYASTALGKILSPGSQLFSYGANLSQPIFEGGALTGQLEYTKAREDELTASYHKAIVSAFSDVENALAALKRTGEQDAAEAAAEKSARAAFALSQRQFEGGIVDITSVLNTQRSLFTASDARMQTRVAHLQAIVGVYRALGGGWQKEVISNQ